MIKLGAYREAYGNSYPALSDCIAEKPIAEKSIVLKYLKGFKPVAASPTVFIDFFTGEKIPGEALCFTDGQYSWRSDLCYYFEKYNFRLPKEFVRKVISQ